MKKIHLKFDFISVEVKWFYLSEDFFYDTFKYQNSHAQNHISYSYIILIYHTKIIKYR